MFMLLVWIALIGLAAWLLITFVKMPPQFKTLIVVVAFIGALLLALHAFGVFHLMDVPVPKVAH